MSTSVPGMMSVACRGPAPRTHCFCIRAHGQYVAVARHASRHVFLNVRSAQRVEVAAAGPGTVAGETGTVTILDELRTASMMLHTKDQAPQEGGQPAAKNPFESWAPNRAGYLRYLAEAKLVFDALEEIIRESTNPWFLALQNNGLERGPALQKDLDWFKATYNMTVECPADSAGHEYARVLRELASTNPPAFLCHYYNIYFAHTAGGRMIGKKASDACLDGAKLEFYQYEGALKRLTDDVREVVIDIGTKMTPEERKVCVDETPKTFQYAGGLMKYMMNTSD